MTKKKQLYGIRLKNKKSKGFSVARPPEDRLVVVLQGIEFNNKDLEVKFRLPDYLDSKLGQKRFKKYIKIDKLKNGDTHYLNKLQNVRYTVRITNTKNDIQKYLQKPGIIVIYDGHARYGRGPCFGTSSAPGEDWGNGTDLNKTGMFRMGYRYLSVPASEIVTHGYKASLLLSSVDIYDTNKVMLYHLHPWLRKRRKNRRFKSLTVTDIITHQESVKQAVKKLHNIYNSDNIDEYLEELIDSDPNNLTALIEGGYKPKEKYWCYYKTVYYRKLRDKKRIVNKPFKLLFVVLHADWNNTKVKPMDIGATDLKCRVFCHFGCNTRIHHRMVIRHSKFKDWVHKGNNAFVYLTKSETWELSPYWLFYLIRYRRFNAYMPWNRLLRFALGQTNQKLSDLQKKNPEYNYRVKFAPNVR